MSHGTQACFAWIMTFDKARELMPEAMAEFEATLEEIGWEDKKSYCDKWRDIESQLDNEHGGDDKKEKAALKKLNRAFRTRTQVGNKYLKLAPGSVFEDDLTSYYTEELDEPFFWIDSAVEEFTTPAKRVKEFLFRADWTVYG